MASSRRARSRSVTRRPACSWRAGGVLSSWVGWNGCPALDSSALPAATYISDSDQSRAGFCTYAAVLRLVLATARVFRIYLSTYNKDAVPSSFIEHERTERALSNKNGGASCERFESIRLTCKRFRVDQRPKCSSAHYSYFFTLPLPVPFCLCVAVAFTGARCLHRASKRCALLQHPAIPLPWRRVCTCGGVPFVFLYT
jgi:hypothetical protein